MFDVIHRALAHVRAHRLAYGLGGGAVATATAVALARRKQAAAVGQRIVDKVRSILGTPYAWGSNDPSCGVDCSGAVVWALRSLGLRSGSWDASAAQLWEASDRVVLPQPGDLVFYGPLLGDPTHVMVYAGGEKVVGSAGGSRGMTAAQALASPRKPGVKELPVDYRSDRRAFGRLRLGDEGAAAVGSLHMLGGV